MFKKAKITNLDNEFNNVITICKAILSEEINTEEKKQRLDFIKHMITNDLKYEKIADIFYYLPEKRPNKELYIPLCVTDDKGNDITSYGLETKLIETTENTVITNAWNTKRLFGCLKMLKKDNFIYNPMALPKILCK